ncbi:MAG: aminotransferase class V-fold PLP-dependent enzyme [Oscillospiraceae bacterium]|nr:aminotransferase class V-fold PLP-dependent enzyme [Oscillospiraceae bacterium]
MIYFDNAATTLQKPPRVADAMRRTVGIAAGPGRGAHKNAMAAADILFNTRETLAEFFCTDSPESVIFTSNATHSLNIALQSLLPKRGVVLHSSHEHNAVMRQLYVAEQVTLRQVDCPLFNANATLENWRKALDGDVKLAVLCHASNVFGSLTPVEGIAALCAARGVPLVLDAAQSCGHVPIIAENLPNTVICVPGHKGLYGPQGTGILIVPQRMKLEPFMRGGTGSLSLRREMPDDYPDRLEAGTQNMPGIAGLHEGVKFVMQKGFDAVLTHEHKLMALLIVELSKLSSVTLYHGDSRQQLGVLSFSVADKDSEDIANELSRYGIAVRAGLHCAPLAHRNVGTLAHGTVRVSFSIFNTEREVREFARRLKAIL